MRLLQEVTLHSKGGSSGDVGHRRRGSGSAACLEARLLQQAAREAAEGLRVRGEAGVRAGTSRLEDSQTPRLLLTSEQQPQRLDSEPGALQSCSSHSEEGRSVHRLLPGVKGAGRTPCREGRAGCLTSLCRCAEQELLCLRGPGGHLSGFYLSLWQAERQDPHRPLDPPLGGTHFHTPPPPGARAKLPRLSPLSGVDGPAWLGCTAAPGSAADATEAAVCSLGRPAAQAQGHGAHRKCLLLPASFSAAHPLPGLAPAPAHAPPLAVEWCASGLSRGDVTRARVPGPYAPELRTNASRRPSWSPQDPMVDPHSAPLHCVTPSDLLPCLTPSPLCAPTRRLRRVTIQVWA